MGWGESLGEKARDRDPFPLFQILFATVSFYDYIFKKFATRRGLSRFSPAPKCHWVAFKVDKAASFQPVKIDRIVRSFRDPLGRRLGEIIPAQECFDDATIS